MDSLWTIGTPSREALADRVDSLSEIAAQQEPPDDSRYEHPVVVLLRPLQARLVQIIAEDALAPTSLEDAGHDEAAEFWVRLHGEDAVWDVEPLDVAYWTMPEVHSALGNARYDITMHLM